MPSVLLVTDDCVLGRGLADVLGEYTNGIEFSGCVPLQGSMDAIQQMAPTIVLIDMNGSVALPAISDLRKSCPDCHICLWVRQMPDELAYQALRLGIRGILRRTLPAEDLISCLSRLSHNEVWFEERLMGGFFTNQVIRLTRRESQLVALLAQGMKNKEIAYTLSLSEGTVKVYLSRLFEKLSVKDRFELALYGLRHLTSGGAVQDTYSASEIQTPSTTPVGVGTRAVAEMTAFRYPALHASR